MGVSASEGQFHSLINGEHSQGRGDISEREKQMEREGDRGGQMEEGGQGR